MPARFLESIYLLIAVRKNEKRQQSVSPHPFFHSG